MVVSPPFEEASEAMSVLSIVGLQSHLLPQCVLEVSVIDM